MDSVILAYALPDQSIARQLADFLEANLPVAVSCTAAIVGPDADLIQATDHALSAEAALVLLSPSSVPKVWNRRTWEPVFFENPEQFQTLLGFVLIGECAFPPLLRNRHFFDATGGILPAFRQIKQWLLRPLEIFQAAPSVAPELENLRGAVADKPGTAAGIAPDLAARFAHACRKDFEYVYRFDCRERSRAGILGDIGSELALPLTGATEQNMLAFRTWCANHRVLFVLAGVAADDYDFATPGGRASVIFTSPPDAVLPGSIRSETADAVRRFVKVTSIDLGWTAVRLLKTQQRLAEALEVLDKMADCAPAARIETERFWIRHDLGYHDGPSVNRPIGPDEVEQLTLPFEQ